MCKACIVIVLLGFPASQLTAQSKKLIPVLIVDGFSNHDWKQTTIVMKWILEKSNRFRVDISTVPADSAQRKTLGTAILKNTLLLFKTPTIFTIEV